MNKRMLAIILGCVLVLSACSSNSGTSTTTPSNNPAQSTPEVQVSPQVATPEEVTLRIVWWGSQARHDATQSALDRYTELNPHVTFQPEFSGWDGYWDKLGVQFSAGSAPDLIQMDAAFLEDYASKGLLADLSSINTEKVSEALVASGKLNDKLFAVPLGNNAYGMVYDSSAVEQLGITKPKMGWTWDDYYRFLNEAKEKVADAKNVVVDNTGISNYNTYQLSHGKGDVFTEEGTLNIDYELYIQFLTETKILRDEGIIPKNDVSASNKDFDPMSDLLVNGTVLIKPLFAAQASSMDSLKPGAYDFVTVPSGAQSGGFLKPSMFWSANEKTNHKDEVIKFIEWFINSEEAATILGTSRGLPVNADNLALLEPDFSDADKLAAKLITEVGNRQPQKFKAEPKGWSNFQSDYGKIYEKFMFDMIDPEQAYKEVIKLGEEYKNLVVN